MTQIKIERKTIRWLIYGCFVASHPHIQNFETESLFQSGGSRRLRGSTKPSSQTCPPCFQRSAVLHHHHHHSRKASWLDLCCTNAPLEQRRNKYAVLLICVFICCFLLQLDSAVCKEMSVSDTEVSDVTWTENGTFNLSEGHTPQTENSEGRFIHHGALDVCFFVPHKRMDPRGHRAFAVQLKQGLVSCRQLSLLYRVCPHGVRLESAAPW